MHTESLAASEAECAAGRTAPRVSLSDIESNIAYTCFMQGEKFVGIEADRLLADGDKGAVEKLFDEINSVGANLCILTICLAVTRNGFMLIGKSAPASAENFDAELGRKLAYEDAVRQLWPLMGYALREKLANG